MNARGPSATAGSRASWLGALLLLVVYAGMKRSFGILICDDAYITLAHARSWDSGLGPIMSALNPVCATSTPLHAAVLALEGLLARGGDYPRLAYWTNAAWDLLGLFFLHRLARRGLGLPEPWPLLAVAAYALSVNALAVSASGMETPMYVALALGGTWYGLCAERPLPALAAVAFLAPLARPEGALLPATLVALRFRRARRLDPASRWALAAAASGLAAFFAFNLYAYGHPLPHSIVAKRLEIRVGWIEGLRAWILNVFYKGPCFGGATLTTLANLAAIAMAAAGYRRASPGAGSPEATLGAGAPWELLAWPFLYFLFFTVTRSSYALFTWYFLPVLPFLILFLIGGMARRARAGSLPAPAAAWMMFLGFLAAVPAQTRLQDLPRKHAAAVAAREGRYREAARLIDSLTPPGHPPTVMIDEVGAIGYWSHARILDTHGLLSPEALPYLGPAEGYWVRMAKLQGKEDPEWIVALRLAKDEGLLYPGEDGLYAGYAPWRVLRLPPHPYNLEMWRRLPPD